MALHLRTAKVTTPHHALLPDEQQIPPGRALTSACWHGRRNSGHAWTPVCRPERHACRVTAGGWGVQVQAKRADENLADWIVHITTDADRQGSDAFVQAYARCAVLVTCFVGETDQHWKQHHMLAVRLKGAVMRWQVGPEGADCKTPAGDAEAGRELHISSYPDGARRPQLLHNSRSARLLNSR